MPRYSVGQDGPATTTITFKITAKQSERLRKLAATDRRPLSAYIRNLLEDYLARTPEPTEQSFRKKAAK
jgi:hypothetical protein